MEFITERKLIKNVYKEWKKQFTSNNEDTTVKHKEIAKKLKKIKFG